jgi:hypothetical protein
MKKLSEKSRRVLRAIYRTFGVTAVSFIFQACYGIPLDRGDDVAIRGSVKSKKTDKPISGIMVSIDENTVFSDLTDSDGYFIIFLPRKDYYTVKFEDIDGMDNDGLFKQHITTVQGESPLQVYLEEDDEA